MPGSGSGRYPVPGGSLRPPVNGRELGGRRGDAERRHGGARPPDAGGVRAGPALLAQLQPGSPRGRRAGRLSERLGPEAADQLRREVGRVLRRELRVPDFVVPYGSDEFAIVLPETDQAGPASR